MDARELRSKASLALGLLALPLVARADDVPAHDAWLQVLTERLVATISAPGVAPHVAVIALLAAMGLGALHAFSPGHGKTIVGAYLIGSRSTPRHAVFLGVTVTITHTLVVFALAFATLVASRYVAPEKLFPVLGLLSGLLVLGMGLVLLSQRWGPARRAIARGLAERIEKALPPSDSMLSPLSASRASLHPVAILPARKSFGMTARRGTRPEPSRSRADRHAHSHGGRVHSHLPPGTHGETVGWRGLLALGVSGGLVPCPSAMVLLLAAIALNKTFYGLLMVVAFSVGLALTLIAVGIVFIHARERFGRVDGTSLWPQILPAMSAALITAVGVVLCYGALATTGLALHR